MIRVVPIAVAAEALVLSLCHSAYAASDITIAAIALGRLYVAGTTEQPRQPVVLEGQFRTESDEAKKFQYELIYHPARCIVSVTIDNKAYEAVVGNCGQQGPPVPSPAPAETGHSMGASVVSVRPLGPSGLPEPPNTQLPASAPFTSAILMPPNPCAADKSTSENIGPHTKATQIMRPPMPPQRPIISATSHAKAVPLPPTTIRKPKLKPKKEPSDLLPLED